MTKEAIAEKIKDIIREKSMLLTEIKDTDTRDDLWLDSIDVIELICDIEKHFNVSILDDALGFAKNNTTVKEFTDEITKLILK